MSRTDSTYPGGFPAILEQMDRRRAPFVYGPDEALPPIDVEFNPLKTQIVGPIPSHYESSRTSFARKFRDLSQEFEGRPALLRMHGLLVANLRRREQPEHTAALFQRLWTEEANYLIAHLDARWLVSAITTFGDHGKTEVQRSVGQSMSVLFGMMKLYETERLYSGARPDQPFAIKRKSAQTLPMEMDAYALVGGGLDVNLLGRLWHEACHDSVIKPLAHHLLEQLIHEPAGIFRRLTTMKTRRSKQLKANAETTPSPVEERSRTTLHVPRKLVNTDAATIRWGTVTLTNAPLTDIARFAAHHLEIGAARVSIYLDDPNQDAKEFLTRNPAISVTTCDDAWWALQKKPRMKAHQMRQVWCATQCYNTTELDWLANIDIDEFILPKTPLAETLAAVQRDKAALVLEPVELLANSHPEQFRLTPSMANEDKAVLAQLYPTFGNYLRGGFLGHVEGKLITRRGLGGVRLGLHQLAYSGANVENVDHSDRVYLGHAHAPSWESFRGHLQYRMAKGSYRKAETDIEAFKLRDVLEFLIESEGEVGLRNFFDEVCAATPELVDRLRAAGMLYEHPLNLDDAVARNFGPLPKASA